MSSRTQEELIAEIDKDLAWRKKELSALRFAVASCTKANEKFIVRAAIALVYAHWEGYVKDAATRYLKYVSQRRLEYAKLAAPFAALGVRNDAKQLMKSADPKQYIEAYLAFRQKQEVPSRLPQDGVIDTGSNLTYKRFRHILSLLGIDCSQYDTREAMIDQQLVMYRNNIAHGHSVWPALDDYATLHAAVIDMLTAFRTQIADAVSTAAYRLRQE